MCRKKYASCFTAYKWDDFVARQYKIFLSNNKNIDKFLIFDATSNNPPEIKNSKVFTKQDFIDEGYANFYQKSFFWWNLDYLFWGFFENEPDYDYYVFQDYDSVINIDLETLLNNIAKDGIDFVASPVRETETEHDFFISRKDKTGWCFYKQHAPIYADDEIDAMAIPIAILSRRAMEFLFQKRKQLSEAYNTGKMTSSPFCEVFIPTELRKNGSFKIRDILNYGKHDGFDWKIINMENELKSLKNLDFIHPILDAKRHINNTIYYNLNKKNLINIKSDLYSNLRKNRTNEYIIPLLIGIYQKFINSSALRRGKEKWRDRRTVD